MFLRAGALSLALLLASRAARGWLRESAQAAAFGASGLADVAVLMLTLPDWLAGRAGQRRAGLRAAAGLGARRTAGRGRRARSAGWRGVLLGRGLAPGRRCWSCCAGRPCAVLAGGLPAALRAAGRAGAWCGAPLALPAGAAGRRCGPRALQHERDFAGMYGANLVVNVRR